MEYKWHTDTERFIIALLAELKANGFAIGIDTHTDALRVTRAFFSEQRDGQLEELKKYIAPIVCRSANDRQAFIHIYNGFAGDAKQKVENTLDEYIKAFSKKEATLTGSTKGSFLRNPWAYIVPVFLLLAAIFITDFFGWFKPILYTGNSILPRYISVGQLPDISPGSIFENNKDTAKFTIEQRLLKQGDLIHGWNNEFVLENAGIDTFTMRLQSQKYKIDTTIVAEIFVYPAVDIKIRKPANIVYTNSRVNYYLEKRDSLRFPYTWYIDSISKDNWQNRDTLTHTFPDSGTYNIAVRYDVSADPYLSTIPQLYFSDSTLQVVRTNGVQIFSNSDILPGKITTKISQVWIAIMIVLLLVCAGMIAWLYMRIRKTKPAEYKPGSRPLDNFSGDAPPYELQFPSRDTDITDNKDLRKLATHLIKTIETPIRIFDSRKTVIATIKNLDLIAPVFRQKQSPLFYLFLLDREYANSQQFELFSYLANFFIKKAVNIDFYFYHQQPGIVYKYGEIKGISVQELASVYHHSQLLLFASGYQFIEFSSPVLEEKYRRLFTNWENPILVTPVPYNDWGSKERVLNNTFKIVPADIAGLVEIIRLIKGETDIKNIFAQDWLSAYESKFVEFEDFSALEKFLGDADLVQWFCALAVNPKINWDVTIEVGKAVLGKKAGKINYENLLKFSRIKWMQEGRFTTSARLMLLKKLMVPNELLARAAILKMLDEMNADASGFSFEELTISRYTHSFVLFFTSNENKEYYDHIYHRPVELEVNAEKFITLYQQQLPDISTRLYLEKGIKNNTPITGEEEVWETPIVFNGENVGLGSFVRLRQEDAEKEHYKDWNKFRKKARRTIYGLMILAGIILLSGFLLYAYKQKLSDSKINGILQFVENTATVEGDAQINIVADSCTQKIIAAQPGRNIPYTVTRNGMEIVSASLNDSTASSVSIPLQDTGMFNITFNINGVDYSTSLQSSTPMIHYVQLASPGLCTLSKTDTVNIWYREGLADAALQLKDTLESLNYLVQQIDHRAIAGSNSIRYPAAANAQKTQTLLKIVNSYFKLSFVTRPRADKYAAGVDNAHEIWLRDVTEKLKDTVLVYACNNNLTNKAAQFIRALNRENVFYAAPGRLNPGACFNELRYYSNADANKARRLAEKASQFFGNTVTLRLMMAQQPAQQRNMELWVKPVDSVYKILWIDDNSEQNNIQDIDYLKSQNIQVDLAVTNREAFEQLNKHIYAYIITDIKRDYPEACVDNKDRAGIEFIQQVDYPKQFIIVCSDEMENLRGELMKNGIPGNNINCNAALRRNIIANIRSGNTTLFYPQPVCVEECTPVERGSQIVLFFAKGKSQLNPLSTGKLDELISRLRQEPANEVSIASYAYSGNSVSYNQSLSERNANSIKTYIAAKGVNNQVIIRSYGSSNPAGNNQDCDRIEITVNRLSVMQQQTPPSIRYDTIRNTYLGYRAAISGNKFENSPVKEKGIMLTLNSQPGKDSVSFHCEVQNSLCPKIFQVDVVVKPGATTQMFANCGLTFIIKLNRIEKKVAYFDAYIGKEVN